MEEYFAFMIYHDKSTDLYDEDSCGIYTLKKDVLIPIHDDLRLGSSPIPYNESIEFLKINGIKSVTTFSPDAEVVASHPYDISDEDNLNECEKSDNWYAFDHQEIHEGSELEKLLTKSGIELRILSPEEENTLTEKLKDYYE